MNHWHNDFMSEYRRRDLVEDGKRSHLTNSAAQSLVYRPGLFTRAMYNFANWMIVTGKQLRKRYEMPALNCNNPPTNSFAR